MEDEFYAIIKLVSGEEIFSLVLVDNYQDENTVIALQNPVMMWSNVTPNGTFIKVKPWMELTDEDIFMIHLDKVITMTESKDKKLINLYNHYINEDDNKIFNIDGKTKPNYEMGYISTVDEAREKLEKVFKLNQET
jgi:hypothetical protein|tara:strand:+ start:273 stop:680 length:408 start_codon:yes stop_codon:yes gene_type:complete